MRTSAAVFLSALFVAMLATPVARAQDEESAPPGFRLARETGAWYVADFLPAGQTLQIKVVKATPVYRTKDARETLGTLAAGQDAQVEGFTRFAYRLRGANPGGNIIVGWVNPRDLEPPEEGFHEKLIAAAERRDQVRQIIQERRVVIGMTTGEVRESWGEPTRRESRVTAEGRQDVWEFVEFEQVPRYNYVRDPQTGQTFRQFSYFERIERTRKSVEFVDGVVTVLADSEQVARRPRGIGLVPAPIIWGMR